MNNAPKTCSTCANRNGFTSSFSRCMKTGYYLENQRKYPTGGCNADFSGWEPRPGVLQRIKAYFFGWGGK